MGRPKVGKEELGKYWSPLKRAVSVLGFGGLCSQSPDFRSFGVLGVLGCWLCGQVYQAWCWVSDEVGASQTLGLVAVEPWVRSVCRRLLEHSKGDRRGDARGSGPWQQGPEPSFVPGPRPGGGGAEVGQARSAPCASATLPRAGGGLRTVRAPPIIAPGACARQEAGPGRVPPPAHEYEAWPQPPSPGIGRCRAGRGLVGGAWRRCT